MTVLQEPVQVMLAPAPRPGAMPGSQAASSHFAACCGLGPAPPASLSASLTCPPSVPRPARSAELSPGPALLLASCASWRQRESLVSRRYWRPAISPPVSRGPCGRWETRGRDGAPSARGPGARHRRAFEPRWWDFTPMGQVSWCFRGFVLREMVEGRR